jgi:hypothetical protein
MAHTQSPAPPTSPPSISAEDARQGVSPGIVRVMLSASLAMVVIGLVVAFLVA